MSLPFHPLVDHLYGRHELFAGFSRDDPDSYARCRDMAVLSYFVRYNRNPATDVRVSTLEALHDNSISDATRLFRNGYSKIVAIMGGHGMKRSQSPSPYADIAHVAHRSHRQAS